jgi:outer membrane protein TolC
MIYEKLWKAIDLEIPLVLTDMETFLVRDGEITEDDLKNTKLAFKKVREAYENEDNAIKLIQEAISILNSIKPKKPFPPEMRIRFEDLKKTLEECIKDSKK